MLTDFWRDIISIGGFLLTLAGLAYAIRQVWLTRSVAEAARRAAERAAAEGRRDYHRHATANAHRHVNEAKLYVEKKEWEKASLRLGDLADQVAQLSSSDPGWGEIARRLREWAATCSRLGTGELKRFDAGKWVQFSVQVQEKIDASYGPFAFRADDDAGTG